MGSFLDRPKTEKETHHIDGNELKAGMSAMQGWRVDMEDAHSMVIGVEGAPTTSWFAVFDGHGGGYTSKYAAEKILGKITSTPEWQADCKSPESIAKAMIRGFLELDADLLKVPEVSSGDDHSGSTAITSFVSPTHIIVGNCGDSRAILIRDNAAVEMSYDHKPYNAGEQARIEGAGGTVSMRRVNGDLAVSRALGDFTYKHAAHLPAEKQQVSAEPEVKAELRSEKDQFLVLACDGIWDVMTNEEVAEFVLAKVAEGVDSLGALAEELIDECLNKGSRDNMSAVIVAFPGAPQPSKEAVEARRHKLESAAQAAAGGGSSMQDGSGAADGSEDPADRPRIPVGANQ